MKRNFVLTIPSAALFAFVLLLGCAQVSAAAQSQSGYWAQVAARDATVRDRPGGRVVKTLARGQYFHVYSSYAQNPSWLMGYACVNGNRGCANRQSVPGFILRSALSGRASADEARPAHGFLMASFAPTFADGGGWLSPAGADFTTAVFMTTAASLPAATAVRGETRSVCVREVWMRNDRLWPIQLLYKGDKFIVERYTDGSPNDGRARWAIGRARGVYGRVLVSSLCR
jgi:hypothetical protein